MAKIEFTIPELYKMVFGYTGQPFPLGNLDLALPDIGGIAKTLIGKNDFLGRPYFLPIQLAGVWLPNNPTMSITGFKKIKSTALAGGVGNIKELVSIDDYKLQIRGFCINYDEDEYPSTEVEMLQSIWAKNKSIEIQSDLCSIFGINNVVIESFTLPEIVGKHIQAYELSLLSDSDFDIILIDNV